jgi:hypothetical protein
VKTRFALVLLAAPLLAPLPPLAAGEMPIVRLQGFAPDQIRKAVFETSREVNAVVTGVGSGGRGSLYAYAWLVDLDRNKLRWSMQDAEPDDEVGSDLRFRDELSLDPGRYALYFFAGRRSFAKGAVAFKRMFDQRPEEPSRRFAEVAIDGDDAAALVAPVAEAEAGGAAGETGEIRLAPLGDSAFRRVRFRVTRPIDAEILALGEADPQSRSLADRSWLVRLASRAPVWAMDRDQSEPAGGAGKNRMVRRTVKLEPGEYELAAATDSSHSADEWNALPPYRPEAWGVTLKAPPGAITRADVTAERTVARLAGFGDEERAVATIAIRQKTPVRIYAFAEWSSGHGLLADYGWIEDAATGKKVWAMEYGASEPAGGSSKNRRFDTSLELESGTYRVGYQTDDSHSYLDWNSAAPDDPRSWGITVSTFDPAAVFDLLDLSVAPAGEPESDEEAAETPRPKKK